MKVVTINSSPRNAAQSKTSLLLKHLIKGMRSAEADVTDFDIHDTHIDYCTACFACFNKRFNKEKVCIHQDDMTHKMLPKWQEADLVVYASPVFFHSITAKLKTFFERTLPVYVSFDGEAEDGAYDPTHQAKHPSLAFLSVSGSPEVSAFDDFRKYISCFDPVAEIYRTGSTLMSMPFCKSRVDDVLTATEKAGVELVQSLRISTETMARITQPLHDDAEFIARVADAHQTLLPGHRALMSFPTEAKRELRALPDFDTATTPHQPEPRKRTRIKTKALEPDLLQKLEALRGGISKSVSFKERKRPTNVQPHQEFGVGDIAIIGASGRFGAAQDLNQLWDVLKNGQELVEEVTRWDLNKRYQGMAGYCRHGALLEDIAGFDARFFRIADQEARFMDPQQRIFLEECWHALEDAGYAGLALKALRSGVFAGCSDGDYRDLFDGETPPQAFWGNAPSVIASRIAYVLDLEGPALGIDTACSSALVAIDLACKALRSGEIDLAIAGGVTVQCTPRLFDAANNAQMLSQTGQCFAFDARANGFVLGEGAGALILRRLADALVAGDSISAVIKASGTNQDGATNGLTAPSASSQTKLMRDLYTTAQITPRSIQMIEAHGTGTKLGDPIEFKALTNCFNIPSQLQNKIALGSIKGNIGHAGAAAGVAGVLKVLLAMRHQTIPASLNFIEANPALNIDQSPLDVNHTSKAWPRTTTPRRGCVSAFGFSGTNAHLVLEEPPLAVSKVTGLGPHLVVFSGATDDQLRATMRAFHKPLHTERLQDHDLASLSLTLLTGRTHKRHRFAVVIETHLELQDAIDTFLNTSQSEAQRSDVVDAESAAQNAIGRLHGSDHSERAELLQIIAKSFEAGVDMPFDTMFTGQSLQRLRLPKTPFQRKNFWVTDPGSVQVSAPTAQQHTYLKPVFERFETTLKEGQSSPFIAIAAPGYDRRLGQTLRDKAETFWEISANIDNTELGVALTDLLSRNQCLIWLAPKPSEIAPTSEMVTAQIHGVELLFRALKEMVAQGQGARPLDLTVITQQTMKVHNETIYPEQASIHGFVGSINREMHRWQLKVIDLPLSLQPDEALIAGLSKLPQDGVGVSFAFRNPTKHGLGNWYRHRLIETQIDAIQDQTAYRQGGVYVVLGGAGGLGRAWSEYVIRQYGAQVIWLGRRAIDSDIKAAQAALSEFGPCPDYFSVDANDPQALSQIQRQIRQRFGPVNGLVHSAITLRDASVATMSYTDFQDALHAKVDLSVHAIEAFFAEPFDFVLFFSSMIAFTPSPGQSNYAAGCAFKDAFATALRPQLNCPVKVMNWGYWGDVGVVASDAYRTRMAQQGMASITPQQGNEALEVLLSLPDGHDQLGYMVTTRAVDVPVIDRQTQITLATCSQIRPLPQLIAKTETLAALEPQLENIVTLEKAIAPVLHAQLAKLQTPGVAFCDPWTRATTELLEAYPDTMVSQDAWRAWRQQQDSWMDQPELAARLPILNAALLALPDILSGAVSGTDVLFPDGKTDLIEGLYHGNALADTFNHWTAQAVIGEAKTLSSAGQKIKILEIGAGTGGTTQQVIQSLQDTQQLPQVSEYAYTDVSSAFFTTAQINFGAHVPTMRFKTLNIEHSAQDQGFVKQSYDIVIASNVLHATNDIANALRQAKMLLTPGGLLVLNELSHNTLLTHLTFGTLKSWWGFADSALRLPGGPIVAPNTWRACLSEAGYLKADTPLHSAHRFGQQIILARSDGAVQHSVQTQRPKPVPLQKPQSLSSGYLTRIQKVVGSVLGGEMEIATDEAFTDYGLDSLSGTQMIQKLNTKLGTDLKSGDLYRYPSPAKLSEHLQTIKPFHELRYVDQIKRNLANILKVTTGALDQTEHFTNFGLDALRSDQFAERLTQDTKVSVQSSDIWAHPTIEELAAHLEHAKVKLPVTPCQSLKQVQRVSKPEDHIAIIGSSVKAPGLDTMDALWEVLHSGESIIGRSERWCDTDFAGAFFDDISGFDPGFFNIAGIEARYMDPQQRAFLMTGYKALEDAGYAGDSLSLKGVKQTGVFAGCYPGDYFQLFGSEAPAQSMWGAAGSVVPARLSYFLDLDGPAVSVDTACSSSLVAIHLACQSLRNAECNMAIAGGVALFSTPSFFTFADRANMLSAQGRCHAFDHRADGFVPGEGVGAVILKPLSKAMADGDTIQAVIIGSGMNQDGASNGITAPNGLAQASLLQKIYNAYDIDPDSIGMLEAHGTGTHLGDPVEFDGLSQHFKSAAPGSIGLGSIKSTLGHTLAAAGIFGLFRALLAIKHDCLPPLCNFEVPNAALDLKHSPFVLSNAPHEWREGTKRAGISSFGFSGTNAHVILQEPPEELPRTNLSTDFLFVFSAHTMLQLQSLVGRIADHISNSKLDPIDVSYTLLMGRRHNPVRLAIVAKDLDDLRTKLASWVSDEANLTITNTHSTTEMTSDLLRLARTYMAGNEVLSDQLFAQSQPRRVSLPTYPFDLQQYWVNTAEEPIQSVPDILPVGLLTSSWEPHDLNQDASDAHPTPGVIAVLYNEQTDKLAEQIAHRLQDARVVRVTEAISEEIDTLIDCRPCSELPLEELDWLPWPQAMARHSDSVRYLVVSKGLSADSPRQPDGGVLIGALARMLGQEYSRLHAGHVDFDTATPMSFIAQTTVQEIMHCGVSPSVIWRSQKRFVPRYRDLSLFQSKAKPFHSFPSNKAVWITGGTRGLGLLCAQHLVMQHGVSRLVLSGRTPIAPRSDWDKLAKGGSAQYQTLIDLAKRATALEVLDFDLTEPDAVISKIKQAQIKIGPVGGLVHCAGLADQITPAFIKKTPQSITEVLAPKTTGLVALWNALRNQGATHAILYSSLTAAEPALAVGQSDYAMANAFLDAFATYHTHKSTECRMLSLQWPNWRETGMGEVTSDRMTAMGYATLTNAEGLNILDRAMEIKGACVVLPSTLIPPKAPARLDASKTTAPSSGIESYLSELVASELEIARSRIKPETTFAEYGVDSILINSLQSRLGAVLGQQLDPSLLYEKCTIASLAIWLMEHHSDAINKLIATNEPKSNLEVTSFVAKAKDTSPSAKGAKIAIVGMSCRFPDAPDLSSYWDLIRSGKSAIHPIPESRPALAAMGQAALLNGLDRFDPYFYRLPLPDARAMSPQARLILDGALEAIYHGGYTLDDVKKQNFGVYLGARAQNMPADAQLQDVAHPIRVVGQNYLAATVSEFFDLRGPSMVIDTACASALVAMHTALQALRTGEITGALVGGVNVLEDDGPARMFSHRSLGTQTGPFHVFDKRANGVTLGEGCGVVLLKTLEQALADGDAVYAVLESIALNNDGRTAGPSTPNFEAQADVMRQAIDSAGRKPEEIGYIEVNGSGHHVTDLLELKAISATYGHTQSGRRMLGSIKPNIGHPLSAEAIASFIKVVSMLHHGEVAPCLSGAEPMPFADLTGFELPQIGCSLTELPGKLAGVNVFADGGTNAHALLSRWNEQREPSDIKQPLSVPSRSLISLTPDQTSHAQVSPTQNFWWTT